MAALTAANALAIFSSGLQAVQPRQLVARALQLTTTEANEPCLQVAGQAPIPLRPHGRLLLLAFGKAVLAMAQAVAEMLGAQLSRAVVLVPTGTPQPLLDAAVGRHPQMHIYTGAHHNQPDQATMVGARALLDVAESATEDDVVLVLISGGGSALLALPAESLTVEDLSTATVALSQAGADITELNTMRKHLSEVQGGRLAAACYPARVLALVLSDVVGDPLNVIASGPTVPDDTNYNDCLRIVAKYQLQDKLPQAVIHHLQRGAAGQLTPTPGPTHPCFERTSTSIIGNNQLALAACKEAALALGCDIIDLGPAATGEAEALATRLLETAVSALQTRPSLQRLCVLAGGETTVKVVGNGRGGRNQHMALHAALQLLVREDWGLADSCLFLSAGTDGQDGPTDAAGAVVSAATVAAHRAAAQRALADCDSHTFFSTCAPDALLRPGLTGTNVMDLQVVLAWRR